MDDSDFAGIMLSVNCRILGFGSLIFFLSLAFDILYILVYSV